jgi:cytochrome c peroxidase
MYRQAVPQFSEHYFESDDEADGRGDNGPTGGLMWDGRVDRARDQARLPLLSTHEMANDSAAVVVARVRASRYGRELEQLCSDRTGGAGDPFETILQAFEAFEQEAAQFYPYSSKYDAFLAGEAELTAHERRGLQLFEDPAKGNCASCHRSRRSKSGAPPQFTDYGLVALGVPRNPDIPANADPSWFDLGACGPERVGLRGRSDYCGRFMTPTLRNVATRGTFFHNGVFHSLKDTIRFYAERDTHPERWYPRDANGRLGKFNDLPTAYHGNVNTDPPFGGRPGSTPAMSDREIDDLIAFLHTLTDGYRRDR